MTSERLDKSKLSAKSPTAFSNYSFTPSKESGSILIPLRILLKLSL
mgnify:CR=1 FL=1